MDRQRVEQALREFFAASSQGLVAAYLFGSVARGSAQTGSDVDLAILYSTAPEASLQGTPLALEAKLEKQLALPVQIVVLNTAPVDLVHRVLRDGRLLIDLDPSARIRFEVRARNEYFDLLPVLRRYRRLAAETP
jgi:predicted nucleotidyltransferase